MAVAAKSSVAMELTKVKSIETAITQIDAKKQKLKKAFEDLQSHSGSSLSLTTINWLDLDSYFTSLQSHLLRNFSLLKTLDSSNPPKSNRNASQLATLCRNMDGISLRKYLIDRPKEMSSIRLELLDALKHFAPDPGALVLDALEGFCHGKKILTDPRVRTACVLLLEELTGSDVEIGPSVKERARSIAAEWHGRICSGAEGEEENTEGGAGLEKLGYLHLLAAYKLFSDDAREVNQLVEYVVSVSKYRQAVYLCRNLYLHTRVPDVIQRLIMNGKHIIALKFIFEFGLADQFPPVPLLKAHLTDTKKVAQNIRKSGKNSRQALNEAGVKEINALKSVIRCVKDNELESQFPVHDLLARIEKLEKEQADRKRSGSAPVHKPQQKMNQLKQNGKKRMRAAGGPSTDKRKVPANSLPSSQQSFATLAGVLTDHASPYLSRPTGPYAGSSFMTAAPYGSQSVDLYGLQVAAPMGYSSNQNPAASNPYSSSIHAQPVHYESTVGYGGYDVAAQYHHPVYYPQ